MNVLWFRDIGIGDVARVGGKNASLGEMVRELVPRGVRVPDGFATTADAFREFVAHNALEARLRGIFDGLDLDDVADLQRRGAAARAALQQASLPPDLARDVTAAYERLSGDTAGGLDVAVRSSATAEDLPDASFAGQQETYLNVRGARSVLEHVQRCFTSLFTDRAISYRAERGYDQLAVALSVGVQRMVRSDLASSGVIFTLDPESGFREVVLITAAWGLGENVVQGAVEPDEYLVHKPTLRGGYRPIVKRSVGGKELELVYDAGGGRLTRNVPVPAQRRARLCLTDDEVLELARMAVAVEDHYSGKKGAPCPMDIEWAKDGRTGELFVVQARPETVESRKAPTALETWRLRGKGPVVVSGIAVGGRIASGPARIVRSPSELSSFVDGEVLVAERTDPDWEPVMRRASAIVTDHGGRTCHAAIVSRELGLPAVVGTGDGTRRLRPGEPYTVVCSEGEVGRVLAGEVPFEVERSDLAEGRRPRTKVMMNVGNPAEAFRLARLPSDGVGLLRIEFVITSAIGVHPNALVGFDRLADPEVRAEIERRAVGYADKSAFFVDKLAEGVGTIAAAFWPRDVIVRLSDFKTNEYAGLVGGAAFEPHEENPMIGWRGASRYYAEGYKEGFALECRALARVRDEMGLTNLKVMVPFCRTVEEGRKVVAEMAAHGLARGRNGLEVYVMCEIPSNAILAEAFAEVFDGFSIGSNDLTQLTLGVDRDSETVSALFDERDPAVLWMIRRAIQGAHAGGRKIGICGQAPSDWPEFAKFLVDCGIDSISLNPDTVLAGTARIASAEDGRAPGQAEAAAGLAPPSARQATTSSSVTSVKSS